MEIYSFFFGFITYADSSSASVQFQSLWFWPLLLAWDSTVVCICHFLWESLTFKFRLFISDIHLSVFFLILIANYMEYENLIFCPSVLYHCCLALLFHCPWHNWTPDDPGECKCLWIPLQCLHLTNVSFVPTDSLQRN